MKLNNKGFYSIKNVIIVLLVSLISIATYYWYFSKNAQISSYYSVGFVKFKLPELTSNQVDEFLKNSPRSNCYSKEYFSKPNLSEENNFELRLYNLPENPLCKEDLETYPFILIREATDEETNDKNLYTWEKADIQNNDLEIFKNTNNTNTNTKLFLIASKESDKKIVIETSYPILSENLNFSLEYNYILKLLNNLELKKFIEFKGLSNCQKGECNNLKFIPYHLQSNKPHDTNKGFIIRTYRLSFIDLNTGNEYYINLSNDKTQNTEIEITDFSKLGNEVVFSSRTSDVTNLNNTNSFYKITTLNLETSEINEIIKNPANLPIQSFETSNENVFYITGLACGDSNCGNISTNKVIYQYNYKTKETKQLTSDKFSSYDAFKKLNINEKEASVQIASLKDNKLLLSFQNINSTESKFLYFDLNNNNFSEVLPSEKPQDKNLYKKLFIKKGIISIED